METIQVGIELRGYAEEKEQGIVLALRKFFPESQFEGIEVERIPGAIFFGTVADLNGWEEGDQEEFIETLAGTVWEANGAFCEMTLKFVPLSSVPNMIVEMERDSWERIVEKGRN